MPLVARLPGAQVVSGEPQSRGQLEGLLEPVLEGWLERVLEVPLEGLLEACANPRRHDTPTQHADAGTWDKACTPVDKCGDEVESLWTERAEL